MASQNVAKLIEDTIHREGDYVNHPSDRGGPTKYGITIPTYADYFGVTPEQVHGGQIMQMKQSLAANIYMKLYYVRPGICHLPELIKPIVFDMGVNHGTTAAIKMLQQALTSQGYSVGLQDGVIGSKTIIAATKAVTDLGESLVNSLVNFRVSFYQDIIRRDPTQKVFEKGWLARAESFRVATA